MNQPDVAVFYDENISKDIFDEFKESVATEKLDLLVESKPEMGAYACAEWFIPTAIIAYIGKSYFDGFLKEMGKDHYATLKEKLATLTRKTMVKPRIEPVLFGTEGKINRNNPYSLAFSICADANDGSRIKLLLPKPSDTENYEEIVYKFLEFLNSYHSGVLVMEDIGFDNNIRPPAGHIFVHLNPETNSIEWLDERLYR